MAFIWSDDDECVYWIVMAMADLYLASRHLAYCRYSWNAEGNMRGNLEKAFWNLKLFWKWIYSELSWEDHKYTERNKNILRSERKKIEVSPEEEFFPDEKDAEIYRDFLIEHAQTVAAHANTNRPIKIKDAYENGAKWLIEAVDTFDLHDDHGGVYFHPCKSDAEVEELFTKRFTGIVKAVCVIDVSQTYESKLAWEIPAKDWEKGIRKAELA